MTLFFPEKLRSYLPPSAAPYAALARLDRPTGIWLLLLPGWWAIVLASGGISMMNFRDWWIFIMFGIGAVAMRAAGCVVNDLWDRELDKKVGRTMDRPLASGELSVKQAFAFLGILLFIGFLILIQMNIVTIALGVLSLPLIALYPLMKRITWWPQAFLGLTFNFGALMGWSAITGTISLSSLLLYAGGIFWTLGYDTVYAQQDKEDDALAGIKSSARALGDNARGAVAGFYGAAWTLIVSAGIFGAPYSFAFLLLIPALGHMLWLAAQWKTDDPSSALKTFRASRDTGLLILAAFALS